jgi:hypothetical protein
MRTFVESNFRSFAGLEGCAGTPAVFVETNDQVVSAPLPAFEAASPPSTGH